MRTIHLKRNKTCSGWLCVDVKDYDTGTIVFFRGRTKPRLVKEEEEHCVHPGQWTGHANSDCEVWTRACWRKDYGPAKLPAPGACERVQLEVP